MSKRSKVRHFVYVSLFECYMAITIRVTWSWCWCTSRTQHFTVWSHRLQKL